MRHSWSPLSYLASPGPFLYGFQSKINPPFVPVGLLSKTPELCKHLFTEPRSTVLYLLHWLSLRPRIGPVPVT